MSASVTQLTALLQGLVDEKEGWIEELTAWLNGTAIGGPFGDGRYPVTDRLGNIHYIESPARLGLAVASALPGGTIPESISINHAHAVAGLAKNTEALASMARWAFRTDPLA